MLQSSVIFFCSFLYFFAHMAKQEDIFVMYRMQKSMDLFFRQAKFTMV
jgi:hypothetical protein